MRVWGRDVNYRAQCAIWQRVSTKRLICLRSPARKVDGRIIIPATPEGMLPLIVEALALAGYGKTSRDNGDSRPKRRLLSPKDTGLEVCGYPVRVYGHEGDTPAVASCFDANVSADAIREIARRKPLRAVFRDASFASSQARINAGELFKTFAPDTTVKVI